MKVVLPDNSELELPDGATGLDAARAIGPKLAEQAVLVRANGRVQDLRLPLARRRADPDPHHARQGRPRRARRPPPLLCAPARRGRARLYPGVKIAIGPPIENGFYYDFDFPEPIREEDLERIEAGDPARAEGGPHLDARGDLARRGDDSCFARTTSLQGRARRHRRGRHLALHAEGDFTDLCRGPHLQNSKPIKALKLTGLAGAYWRGDSATSS